MALPLDPESGLFPDTLVPAFVEAPELEALADEVIASFDEFEPIQTGMREAGIRGASRRRPSATAGSAPTTG